MFSLHSEKVVPSVSVAELVVAIVYRTYVSWKVVETMEAKIVFYIRK